MYRSILLSFLAFFIACLPSNAMAKGEVFEFDKDRSRIFFEVDNAGYSKMIGEFKDFEGQVFLDEKNPESSQVVMTINIGSLSMGNKSWDKKALSMDFFDVRNYPKAYFKSRKIDIIGDGIARLSGDLTLLGVTKQIGLDVRRNNLGLRPDTQEYTAGFSITGSLRRSDFYMLENVPLISDEVKIRAEIEAVKR